MARDFDGLVAAAAGLDMEVVIKTRREIGRPLPPNVRIISERISFRALRELYAAARIVVVPMVPAVHASGVNGVLEALAMGRPTVVTDIEGIHDFVRHDVTMLSVPPGDPREFARSHPEITRRSGPGRTPRRRRAP